MKAKSSKSKTAESGERINNRKKFIRNMKKIIVSLFTIAAAFGFGGCAQSDVDDNSGFVSGNAKPLKIVGTTTAAVTLESDGDDTRATVKPGDNGKYKAQFSENDMLRAFEMYQNEGAWFCEEVEVDPVTAESSTMVERKIYEKTPQRYDYLLFYPASALTEEQNDSNKVIKDYGTTPTVKLTVPTVQRPTADAPDAAATILFAKALNVDAPDHSGENTLDNQLQKTKFRPLTAYGKMTLKDLDNDKKVKNVKVTILGYRFPNGNSTTSHITGTYNSYQFNNEYNTDEASSVYYDPNATTGYNYVELDYEKNPLTPNNGEAVVWFSIVSNMYLAGQDGVEKSASSFIVKVTYEDNTEVEKQFNTKGKTGTDGKPTFKFTNGYVTSFSASMKQNAGGGADPANPTAFRKVTSIEATTDNDKIYVITVSLNGTQYALRNDGNVFTSGGNYANCAVPLTEIGAAGFALDGEKLTATNASLYTFRATVKGVDGGSSGKYKLFSTTKTNAELYPSAWNNVLVLSSDRNEWQAFNLGNDGTSLAGSNYANEYVYTDDGLTAKASSTVQTGITFYGVDSDTNVGPDMTEPLLEEKLTIVDGKANQYHLGSGIEHLWDGVVTSNSDPEIYHSPYNNNDPGNVGGKTNFPVVLEFNLDVASDVYRMHYYTRVDANNPNCNGDPGAFDVEYQTADGWRPAKAGNFGSATNAMHSFPKGRGDKEGSNEYAGGRYHEWDFDGMPLMGAQAVRLKFYSGHADFITGNEVVFYGAKTVSTPTQQYEKLKITSGKASSEHKEFTSGGTRYVATPIEKLFDGIIGTDADDQIYHSKWGWVEGATNEFPITLSFYINKSDVAEFHYYTKLSATNTANGNVANGMPGQFDVRYRCYGDAEDSYRKINPSDNGTIANAKYDMGQTAHAPYKITFDEVLKDVIEMQLIFYSGSHDDGTAGYIAGREVEIWGIPAN